MTDQCFQLKSLNKKRVQSIDNQNTKLDFLEEIKNSFFCFEIKQ